MKNTRSRILSKTPDRNQDDLDVLESKLRSSPTQIHSFDHAANLTDPAAILRRRQKSAQAAQLIRQRHRLQLKQKESSMKPFYLFTAIVMFVLGLCVGYKPTNKAELSSIHPELSARAIQAQDKESLLNFYRHEVGLKMNAERIQVQADNLQTQQKFESPPLIEPASGLRLEAEAHYRVDQALNELPAQARSYKKIYPDHYADQQVRRSQRQFLWKERADQVYVREFKNNVARDGGDVSVRKNFDVDVNREPKHGWDDDYSETTIQTRPGTVFTGEEIPK